jgi:hypothetical protein
MGMTPSSQIPQPPPQRDPDAQFDSLPGPLRTFLLSDGQFDDVKKLYDKYQFSDELLDKIVDLIGDIDFKYRPFSDLLPALINEIGLPADKAKQFAIELSGVRYLPIEALIEANVLKQIEEWGADPTKFATTKVAARKVTAEALTKEILADAELQLEPRIAQRLTFVLLSHTKGVRDTLETERMLGRDPKVGGVGLPKEVVQHLMRIIQVKMSNAFIVATMPKENPKPKSAISNQQSAISTPRGSNPKLQPAAPKERPTLKEAFPAAKKFSGGSQPPRDQSEEEEIAATRAAMPREPNKGDTALTNQRTQSIASILQASDVPKDDVSSRARLEKIADARLRDIRDSNETRATLSRPKESGGLGLPEAAASTLTNLIEAEFQALMGLGKAEKTRTQATNRVIKAKAITAKKIEQRAREETDRDARIHTLAATSKVLQEKEILLPENLETAIEKSEIKNQKSEINLRPVLSSASVGTNQKPRIEDVKPVRRVAGPIEELRTLSLTAFRRLSKDPKEATLKIRDRIDLQKEESFEQYQNAIRAWRASEPNQTYLALTREALASGKPVTDIMQAQAQASTPTLSPEEFHAILQLNSQLRM